MLCVPNHPPPSHTLSSLPPSPSPSPSLSPQPIAAEWWVGFLFRMQFVGVKLEFLSSRLCNNSGVLSTSSLALFDIKQSEFTFVSNSNQIKNVDFTCHTVIGHDTRYRGKQAQWSWCACVDRLFLVHLQYHCMCFTCSMHISQVLPYIGVIFF